MPFPRGLGISMHGRLLTLFKGILQTDDGWVSGVLFQDVLRHTEVGLVAAGTTQATALALKAAVNQMGTVAASTGVVLPPCQIGMAIEIIHDGAQTLTVYGSAATGDTIDGVATATGVSLTAATRCRYLGIVSALPAQGTQAAVVGQWVSCKTVKSA